MYVIIYIYREREGGENAKGHMQIGRLQYIEKILLESQ